MTGSGKTHLSKILEKKIKRLKIFNADEINDDTIIKLEKLELLIIDNYSNNIEQNLLYSLLNQSKQLEKYILINSNTPIKNYTFDSEDLKSRIDSFLYIGIDLPTDDLLQVIIAKSFSDKQVYLDKKISQYITKNVDRSYDKMFKFLKEIDEFSLSSGKAININLIKKLLNE